PSCCRQLIIHGYRSQRLGASRSELPVGGRYVSIPQLPMRIGGGEGPEVGEGGVEVAAELEGIEAVIERIQRLAFVRGEDVGGAETLVGRLGAGVEAVDAAAPAGLCQ